MFSIRALADVAQQMSNQSLPQSETARTESLKLITRGRWSSSYPLLVVAIAVVVATVASSRCDEALELLPRRGAGDDHGPPPELAEFFRPAADYRGKLGDFRSPLLFDDGSRVESVAAWSARRQQILDRWHGILGRWPVPDRAPAWEPVATARRGEIAQHRIRVGIEIGDEMVDAFLLIPPGAGPFPAVVVPDYEAQSGAGLGIERRDFGWQLTRRGFLT